MSRFGVSPHLVPRGPDAWDEVCRSLGTALNTRGKHLSRVELRQILVVVRSHGNSARLQTSIEVLISTKNLTLQPKIVATQNEISL